MMTSLPEVTPRSRLLVVAQDTDEVRGGTQHQISSLLGLSSSRWHVELSSRNQVLRSLESGNQAQETVVFVQEEGGLSAEYRLWAEACIASGARIVEKNVFGLPSLFRPVHPQYLMSVMSRESACRFVLRSASAKAARPYHFLLRPNMLRGGINPRKAAGAAPDKIRLLRVGRPDPIKWSSWELNYSGLLAARFPEYEFELTLIGAPASIAAPVQCPLNLSVRRVPYLEQVLDEYSNHDVYIHYSRIGETYGNTLAEAQAAGLFVIFAADSRWDCTPSEFLLMYSSIVATRGWLEGHANRVMDGIRTHCAQGPRQEINPPTDRATQGEHNVAVLLGHEPAYLHPLPTRLEALQELAHLMRRVEGVKWGYFPPLWESLRGWKWRERSTPSPPGSE